MQEDADSRDIFVLLSGALGAARAEAQVCTGVDYFDRCLDAIGGRPADGSRPRVRCCPFKICRR